MLARPRLLELHLLAPGPPESSLGPWSLWALVLWGHGADLQGHLLPWAEGSLCKWGMNETGAGGGFWAPLRVVSWCGDWLLGRGTVEYAG